MVETKLFRVEKLWKDTHNFVNSETGAGVRGKDMDEQTWWDIVTNRSKYYYNVETVCVDRAAFCPKATNTQISVTGYQPNDDHPCDLGDDDDDSKAFLDEVPGNVHTNLDGGGLYSTPPYSRSRLTSDTSTTNTNKTRKRSKTLSNKKCRNSS